MIPEELKKIQSKRRKAMEKIDRKIDYVYNRLPKKVQDYLLENVDLVVADHYGIYYPASKKPTIVFNFVFMEKVNMPLHVQRYTVAHECAHAFLKHNPDEMDDAKCEQEAIALVKKWGFLKRIGVE